MAPRAGALLVVPGWAGVSGGCPTAPTSCKGAKWDLVPGRPLPWDQKEEMTVRIREPAV